MATYTKVEMTLEHIVDRPFEFGHDGVVSTAEMTGLSRLETRHGPDKERGQVMTDKEKVKQVVDAQPDVVGGGARIGMDRARIVAGGRTVAEIPRAGDDRRI